jgi:hypothetical protein
MKYPLKLESSTIAYEVFMSTLRFTLISLTLLTLGACNEDAGSRDKGSSTGATTTTGATAETKVLIQNSQMFHDLGTTSLSTTDESLRILGSTLPAYYRTIPKIETDDEAYQTSVRPTVSCGLGTTLTGVTTRTAECASLNPNTASWLSINYGRSGEGNWKLVAFNPDAQKEVWKDLNTGLLWSDIIIAANWCKASGNIEGITAANPVDCTTLAAQTSTCENYVFDSGLKAKWRLPTRNDFLQADLNGARFILKHGDNALGFWTATVNSALRSQAWTYLYQQGLIFSQDMTSLRQVRCVGVAAN